MNRSTDSSSAAAVRAGIDDLIAEIDDGLNQLNNGFDVDLSGFDRRVESICEAAQRLEGDAALSAATALTLLVDRLNQLTQRLETAQSAAARNGAGVNREQPLRLREANQAYRAPRPDRDPGRGDE
jgi:hypothetical protein